MFNAKVAKVMVFECRESFTPANVPPEVLPVDGQESWTVVVVGEQEATVDDFNSKLRALLRAEGKTEKRSAIFHNYTFPACN